jgi:molybdopterin-guanine dinucleotide biosynthesis protein A
MGGVDKGLRCCGRPMVQWVIERLEPQVDELLINANQNLETYEHFGYRVIPDEIGGFAGPLAGLQRGLSEARHPLVATAPCDSPFLPSDLIVRLCTALSRADAEIAVAKTGDQPQPVFCLCRRTCSTILPCFSLPAAEIDAWYPAQGSGSPFRRSGEAFSNINTPDELESFEAAMDVAPRPDSPYPAAGVVVTFLNGNRHESNRQGPSVPSGWHRAGLVATPVVAQHRRALHPRNKCVSRTSKCG